jgi:lysylphosphatidylglycerol synthetase-like protein (DUF2156 family)
LNDIVGVEAVTAFTALVNAQDRFIGLQGELTNANDTAAKSVERMTDGWFGFQRQIESIKEEIRIAIGENMEPLMRDLMQIIADNEQNFKNLGATVVDIAQALGVVLIPTFKLLIGIVFAASNFLQRHEKVLGAVKLIVVALSVSLAVFTSLVLFGMVKTVAAAIVSLGLWIAKLIFTKAAVDSLNTSLAITVGLASALTFGAALVGIGAAIVSIKNLSSEAQSLQSGTATTRGVHRSGLFFLHKGEQVFNPNNGGISPGATTNNNQRNVNINVEMHVREFEMNSVVQELQKTRMRLEMG